MSCVPSAARCVRCQSTLKKAKVASHSWQCSSRSFSCIDCSSTFTAHSYSAHTQCVSEAEKYQGKLYKGKRQQTSAQQQQQQPPESAASAGQKRSADVSSEAESAHKRIKQASVDGEERKEQPIADLLPTLLQSEVSHHAS